MVLSHRVTATSTEVVAVTGVGSAWTLTVRDPGSTTPGYMDRADCVSGTLLGGSLIIPMAWSSNVGTSGTLNGTAATVREGNGVEAITIAYRQNLAPTDAVTSLDCFKLSLELTVT
jgi:hypothetical protein